MSASRALRVETTDREIIFTREFDAPRQLVWMAWTDPNHVPQWWGPVGFRTTTQRMEVRPGGEWRYVMHGPDGHDYLNLITYLEVVEPERLVYKHGGDTEGEPVNFTVVVRFEELGAGSGTRLTMRMTFPSANAKDFVVREYNALEGGKQTIGRLAEYVETTLAAQAGASADADAFVITRVFRAPRAEVWRAWTERESLMRWFGPKGVTMPECSLDLRPGGVFHYCMRPAEGPDMWAKWVFREIVDGQRLEFVVSFADERGNAIRAPFDPGWPMEMLSTITFVDHAGIGRGTVVTVRWVAIHASEAERRVFRDGRDSMREGWGGTLDRLEEFFAGS